MENDFYVSENTDGYFNVLVKDVRRWCPLRTQDSGARQWGDRDEMGQAGCKACPAGYFCNLDDRCSYALAPNTTERLTCQEWAPLYPPYSLQEPSALIGPSLLEGNTLRPSHNFGDPIRHTGPHMIWYHSTSIVGSDFLLQ